MKTGEKSLLRNLLQVNIFMVVFVNINFGGNYTLVYVGS